MIAAEYVSKIGEHKNVVLSFRRNQANKYKKKNEIHVPKSSEKWLEYTSRIYKSKILFPAKAAYTFSEHIRPHKEQTHSRNVYVAVLQGSTTACFKQCVRLSAYDREY